MKTIKYIITAALACLMLASCSLDENNYTEVNKKTFMRNAKEAESVLLGVYRNMVNDGLYGYHLSLYFTLPTDQAKVEGETTNGFRNVPSNAYGSNQSEIEKSWRELYNAVYDANDFIEGLTAKMVNYDEHDQKLANIYLGEAKTLRALYYFELVRWYGHIALMDDTKMSQQLPSTFVQADPNTVYEFIEKDLLEAIELLPAADDFSVRRKENSSFRLSKGSAQGLLTKVYCTWAGAPLNKTQKWAEAAKVAKDLVHSPAHDLLDDYEQLWKNAGNNAWDPKESLIEVNFYSPTMTGQAANDPSGRIGKWNGVSGKEGEIPIVRNAANWIVLPSFLYAWENKDKDARYAISFADYKYTKDGKEPVSREKYWWHEAVEAMDNDPESNEHRNIRRSFNSALYPGKWDIMKYSDRDHMLVDANYSNVNWYILRFADVLLLYAEAINESGGDMSEAYAAINRVRKRAGLEELTPGLGQNEFREAVRKERSYELAFEGHRRQDLTRWGIFIKTITETVPEALGNWHDEAPSKFVASEYTLPNKNELLPIPLRDLDLMSKFVQNPGWGE